MHAAEHATAVFGAALLVAIAVAPLAPVIAVFAPVIAVFAALAIVFARFVSAAIAAILRKQHIRRGRWFSRRHGAAALGAANINAPASAGEASGIEVFMCDFSPVRSAIDHLPRRGISIAGVPGGASRMRFRCGFPMRYSAS